MSALILDTETNSLNGYPIEIAYVPCSFEQGALVIDQKQAFDEYFSCPAPIELGAMAVHHILESDISDKPSYETFRLPEKTSFLIGHNIAYDIQAIQLCDKSINVKPICTLALARMIWPELDTRNLTAMYYHCMAHDLEKARKHLRNAHNARWDIFFTGEVLRAIVAKLAIKDMNSLFLMSEQSYTFQKIRFGKHKGTPIKDLPQDYRDWLWNQSDIDPSVKKALTILKG